MTKRIFRSIFLVALVLLLAVQALVMSILHNHFTSIQFEQLRIETALASQAVANEGTGYFVKLDDTIDCRITWIASNGDVLYDNRSDSDSMVNHLQREEVKQALSEGYGQSVRYSDTLTERYIYAAQQLPDGTVLRLSTSHGTVLQLMLQMFWHIVLILFAAVLLSYFLARRLSREIVRPLNNLSLNAPLSNHSYPEITPLMRRLYAQQNQLQQQSQELRLKQKEFSTVTQSLSEGLILISATGSVLSINPAAAALLEVTPNCIGADFSVANRNAEIALLAEQALRGKKDEKTIALSAGSYLVAASPVRSGGQPAGVVLLMLDVTQKQQAEQLRREFTANVSHELKTPLHAISGYAELMKSGIVAPGDMAAFSEKIYGETQRLIQLVEDTLRLSRLDEGASDMQWTSVDLYDTAQSVLRELSSPAELAGVHLQLTGSSAVIHAIPPLVSAILFNLTDNAVKYNRSGGTVTIQLTPTDSEVLLTVADTGIGIPPEHRKRVFERFYRVDKSHSKEVGGTGLGLSIVKHAALILGAAVELESIPGKGTTVCVRFPK